MNELKLNNLVSSNSLLNVNPDGVAGGLQLLFIEIIFPDQAMYNNNIITNTHHDSLLSVTPRQGRVKDLISSTLS